MGKSLCQSESLELVYKIRGPAMSGDIKFWALHEDQFWRDVETNLYGMRSTQSALMLPKLKDRRAIGFGFIIMKDGRGFNLALVSRTARSTASGSFC